MPYPNHDPNDFRGNWPAGQDDDDRVARTQVLRASMTLANWGLDTWPAFDCEDGAYTGHIIVLPAQLLDLLSRLSQVDSHRCPRIGGEVA